MKKVLVGLSGGVDSAVSALLLKDLGYEVSGGYIRTWKNEDEGTLVGDCPWKEDIEDARAVARHLGIDFQIINLIDAYREKVVEYLVSGYERGMTPNPDIMCNREIKFGVFLEYALKNGFDGIATGHYVQRKESELRNGEYDLYEGRDELKDQSYFLALVKQSQLQKALFPIGDLEKKVVREIAAKVELPNAHKKDSQGICFLGKVSINEFLSHYIPDKPGMIINLEGKILGEHKGLHRYTIGQRKGIGVPSNKDYEKYIVVKKDFSKNELVVGFESQKPEELYVHHATIQNINWISECIGTHCELLAKPRYRDTLQAIEFIPESDGRAKIIFKSEQRGLAPGQILALYKDKQLLGGGYFL